jgi:hypothetical protein
LNEESVDSSEDQADAFGQVSESHGSPLSLSEFILGFYRLPGFPQIYNAKTCCNECRWIHFQILSVVADGCVTCDPFGMSAQHHQIAWLFLNLVSQIQERQYFTIDDRSQDKRNAGCFNRLIIVSSVKQYQMP